MSVPQFKVTKVLIQTYMNNGLTVKQMAEDITTKSGVKCSSAVVKAAAKTYGINLRLKKNPTAFVFEDLDSASPEPINAAIPEADVVYTKVEEPTVQL